MGSREPLKGYNHNHGDALAAIDYGQAGFGFYLTYIQYEPKQPYQNCAKWLLVCIISISEAPGVSYATFGASQMFQREAGAAEDHAMPDVSIVIPTYNRLWSLPQTVESCRGNACAVEIIVVDDGSTDGTGDWLRSQSDIVALRGSNWGKGWAVNRGVQVARGDYIRFLDSDDWLAVGANDGQLATARSSGADVVVAGLIVQDDQLGRQHEHPWVHCDDFIAQQLGECDSSHYSAYLFRTDFVRAIPHRQEFGALDDRMYAIEVALRNPRVAVHPAPTFVHRHHEQQRLQFQSGLRTVATNLALLEICRKSLAILEQRGELTLRRKRAAIRLLWPLAHRIARTHLAEACEVVKWIKILDPEFAPPRDGLLGKLYRSLGFAGTERLLSARRSFVQLLSR